MSKRLILSVILVSAWHSCGFSQPLFVPPVNLGPKINTATYESDPFWDAPRNRLYFVSARVNEIPYIFFSDWTNTGWTDPVKLGSQISGGDEQSPSVSPDGQRLYYVSSSRGGYFWDIWVSTWDSSLNDWGTPVNVGYPVNTSGVEFSAHLGPDGRHLYFDSDGAGRCGIYASEWNGSSWAIPQPQWGCGDLPEYPSVPADGQWLYFDEFVSDGKSIKAATWGGLVGCCPPMTCGNSLGEGEELLLSRLLEKVYFLQEHPTKVAMEDGISG